MPNPMGKTGSGAPMSGEQENRARRERLKELALTQIDLDKDPYFMKNHLGSYECKLCLTLHTNEANYLVHTQGRKHQTNIAMRAAREEAMKDPQPMLAGSRRGASSAPKKSKVRIGRPGYKVTKQKDPETEQLSLLFEIDYPEIEDGLQPRHRFMSSYEQKVEAPDKQFQYLLFAADPYETIGFKIPNKEIDKSEGRFFTDWNRDTLKFTLQLFFKKDEKKKIVPLAKIGEKGDAVATGTPVAAQDSVAKSSRMDASTWNPMEPQDRNRR